MKPLLKSSILVCGICIFGLNQATAQTEQPKPVTIGEGRHVVAKKQTLYNIGKKYHISIEKLMTMNNLTSENLEIGQELVVKPGIPVYYHIVEKGQTLYSIAKLYNTDVKRIKKMNKLKSNNLKEGKELIIDISNAPVK
jgi:LysM repeat protein